MYSNCGVWPHMYDCDDPTSSTKTVTCKHMHAADVKLRQMLLSGALILDTSVPKENDGNEVHISL